MKKGIVAVLAAAWIGMGAAAWALTPEQVLELKKAGVEDETIRMMIAQEAKAAERPGAMGVREIKDRDGRTVVRYSVGPGTSDAARAEEARKVEQAWEMLRNLRIDNR